MQDEECVIVLVMETKTPERFKYKSTYTRSVESERLMEEFQGEESI